MDKSETKLKILFLTTPLYDNLADSLLIGLRKLYGENCVEFPRKAILYGDFPCVYGRGFTLWSHPIQDIPRGPANFENVDLVIYSNYRRQKPIDWRILVRNSERAPRIIYVDGNDDGDIAPEARPFFKRELIESQPGVFSIGFGVPDQLVRPFALDEKTQLFQTHVQDPEFSKNDSYLFTAEKDYYDDLAKSYFGITMKKGGWDCLRHYEIAAAGALVMFKHFDQKPELCAPQCPHFVSYSSREDFMEKTGRLLPGGKPGAEYFKILQTQREWLLANATCSARARNLISRAETFFADRAPEKMPELRFKPFRRAKLGLFLLKENIMLRAITFVKLHPFVNWFYYKMFKKIPGVAFFVSRILMKEKPDNAND